MRSLRPGRSRLGKTHKSDPVSTRYVLLDTRSVIKRRPELLEQTSAASNACCWSFPVLCLLWGLSHCYHDKNRVRYTCGLLSQMSYGTSIFYQVGRCDWRSRDYEFSTKIDSSLELWSESENVVSVGLRLFVIAPRFSLLMQSLCQKPMVKCWQWSEEL